MLWSVNLRAPDQSFFAIERRDVRFRKGPRKGRVGKGWSGKEGRRNVQVGAGSLLGSDVVDECACDAQPTFLSRSAA